MTDGFRLNWHRFIPLTWQMGFYDYLKKTYFAVNDRCRVDNAPTGKTSPMKLVDFVGAFVLVGIGYAISTIAFIVERIVALPSSAKRKIGQQLCFG